ncbi:hypothetical protein QMA56_06840 [Leuconostoc falkenbergense]|uniref:hypothetical protein n=1 Tax=Leuconostoc falkenbergense TaxID=2766470 RepID=UPI0024AD0268|nr:hypothetical protein [Leuconostoc falkenbergense]MDI6667423.1 hypothetical protein [Leuconostoc falkenbergense]
MKSNLAIQYDSPNGNFWSGMSTTSEKNIGFNHDDRHFAMVIDRGKPSVSY